MLNLTVAVILHGITLTGNLGTIEDKYCPTVALSLSGDNWVVSCINNNINISSYSNWTTTTSGTGVPCITNKIELITCP